MSRLVVQIPFWVYLIGIMLAVTIGGYVFTFALIAFLVVGGLHLVYRYPVEAVGLLLLVVTVKYWKVALPIIALFLLVRWFTSSEENNTSLLKFLTSNKKENL